MPLREISSSLCVYFDLLIIRVSSVLRVYDTQDFLRSDALTLNDNIKVSDLPCYYVLLTVLLIIQFKDES